MLRAGRFDLKAEVKLPGHNAIQGILTAHLGQILRQSEISELARTATSLTASTLNSRLSFRLVISTIEFHGHYLIFVSTKPAAAHYGAASGPPPAITMDLLSKKGCFFVTRPPVFPHIADPAVSTQ